MTEETAAPKRGFGTLALILTFVVGLIGGGAAVVASAHGMGMHRWAGHHFMHDRGDGDGREISEHAGRMAGHLARRVDATDAQKQKLIQIAQGLAREVQPVRQKMYEARKRAMSLLTAPATDRAAIEALRAEQMALADEVSRKLVTALADVAETLTPEQRAKLAKKFEF
jgi:Spy/CpxP family protein refolding chaperone